MVIPFAYILRKLHLNGEKVIKKKTKTNKNKLNVILFERATY